MEQLAELRHEAQATASAAAALETDSAIGILARIAYFILQSTSSSISNIYDQESEIHRHSLG
jgi:uncharacterized membrane protein